MPDPDWPPESQIEAMKALGMDDESEAKTLGISVEEYRQGMQRARDTRESRMFKEELKNVMYTLLCLIGVFCFLFWLNH